MSRQTDELVEVFRNFEAELWQRINEPDADTDRRAVARWAAGELARVQDNVAKELEIVGADPRPVLRLATRRCRAPAAGRHRPSGLGSPADA